MDEPRKKRYLEKLEHAEERLTLVEEWLPDQDDTKSRLAAYKAFQEAVEAEVDVCAMFLNDEGLVVSDDYENIQKASGKLFPDGLEGPLKEANGLRNRLVHESQAFSGKTCSSTAPERCVIMVSIWVSPRSP